MEKIKIDFALIKIPSLSDPPEEEKSWTESLNIPANLPRFTFTFTTQI